MLVLKLYHVWSIGGEMEAPLLWVGIGERDGLNTTQLQAKIEGREHQMHKFTDAAKCHKHTTVYSGKFFIGVKCIFVHGLIFVVCPEHIICGYTIQIFEG